MMRRFVALVVILATVGVAFFQHQSAQANVTALVLSTRTCGTISAFLTYDSFSEGDQPYYAVFTADLNGNGIFGEAGEPIKYVRVIPGGNQAQFIGTILSFAAVPEGTTIAVTAYEVDSAGTAVSHQVSPVSYVCAHKPARNLLPPNTGIVIPGVGIVAKITAAALLVYTQPNAQSSTLGGLANGALVNVSARNLRGDWVQIDYRGQTGWIMWNTNAILFGPYMDLPVLPNLEATPTFTPTAILTVTPGH